MDGHEDSISATRTQKVSGLESSDGKFIIENADWSTSVHRGANWSKTDGSSVCPIGFRIPTMHELKAEIPNTDATKNSLSFLKTPWGSVRMISGDIYSSSDLAGGRGGMWTSTVSDVVEEIYGENKNGSSNVISGAGSYVLTGSALFSFRIEKKLRTRGYYVRCIKP